MFALIAAIVGIAIVVIMWRLLDPKHDTGTDQPSFGAPALGRPQRARQIPPDDDPEFLRELARRIPRRFGGDDRDNGEDPQPV